MYRYIITAFAIGDSELSDERAWHSYSLPSFPGDHHMAFCLFASIARHPGFYGYQAALAATLAVVWANPLPAIDVSLTAIELYSGASGPAYVHIGDVNVSRSACSAVELNRGQGNIFCWQRVCPHYRQSGGERCLVTIESRMPGYRCKQAEGHVVVPRE